MHQSASNATGLCDGCPCDANITVVQLHHGRGRKCCFEEPCVHFAVHFFCLRLAGTIFFVSFHIFHMFYLTRRSDDATD